MNITNSSNNNSDNNNNNSNSTSSRSSSPWQSGKSSHHHHCHHLHCRHKEHIDAYIDHTEKGTSQKKQSNTNMFQMRYVFPVQIYAYEFINISESQLEYIFRTLLFKLPSAGSRQRGESTKAFKAMSAMSLGPLGPRLALWFDDFYGPEQGATVTCICNAQAMLDFRLSLSEKSHTRKFAAAKHS